MRLHIESIVFVASTSDHMSKKEHFLFSSCFKQRPDFFLESNTSIYLTSSPLVQVGV